MTSRKEFLRQSALIGAATIVGGRAAAHSGTQAPGEGSEPAAGMASQTAPSAGTAPQTAASGVWPDGSRLVISVSMQFEAGGEPETDFDSPFPPNLEKGYTDLPAKTWFQYGYKEGIPRLLDLWDKHGVKVTSHTIGEAARRNPALAKEIISRGHEIAGHGLNWTPQYNMSYEDEKAFIKAGLDAIKEATGQTTIGYNCNWLRRSKNTIPILQELGFIYHIDDLSRDEPFLILVKGKNFAVVPYTLRCNDIQLLEGRYFSSAQFGEQLKLEFDQLYAEGAHRKRQMSVSTHDRISGTPAQTRVLDEFLTYARQHAGVTFKRKDEIARWTLSDAKAIVDSDYR